MTQKERYAREKEIKNEMYRFQMMREAGLEREYRHNIYFNVNL